MSKEILLIDENGNKLNVTDYQEALTLVKNKSKDLVCVNDKDEIHVYRIMDSSKERYRKNKQKKQSSQKTKEVKFGISIAPHDKDTKIKQIDKFLKNKNKVKITVEKPFRSSFTNEDICEFVEKILSDVNETYVKDNKLTFNGRKSNIIIRP